ncbi:MAG: YceI family protein [Actinomycetota bacterium]
MTAPQLPTGTWILDPSATTITVSARKLGVFTVPATLAVVSGTIDIDDDHHVTNVDIVADASSYTSKNPKRNEHITGADFLDADAHPTIVFRAHQVTPSNSGLTSKGTVTIKGRTAPIDVAVSAVEVAETAGAFVATATVDRNTIGVDKLPGLVIGRRLDITVNATASKNP